MWHISAGRSQPLRAEDTRPFNFDPQTWIRPATTLPLARETVMEMMALRASASARPPITSSSTLSSSSSPKVFTLPKIRNSITLLPTSTTLSLLSLGTTSHSAKALTLPKEKVVSSLTQVEQTIDQVQEVGSGFIDAAGQVFQVLLEALKLGYDAALPVLQQVGEQALKVASPAVSVASKKAQDAMQSAGIDSESVMGAAKTVTDAAQQTTKVIEDAKPIAMSTVETIANSDPVVIAETAAALVFAYILFPSIWSSITFGLRGYKGALTPAQTLDLMCTKNYVMVDIRAEKEKNKAGIPQLPPSAKSRMLAIPLEELSNNLRGLVRNAKKVEAEIAALKISYLKKISKGTNIVIMDSYSDSAKIVAKTLTSLGFNNCWIMVDGFSGGRGWLQSRLGTDSYNFSLPQVLSPSRIIPAGAGRFGTTASSSSRVQSSRTFLPGSN